jgi:hypothetical protein
MPTIIGVPALGKPFEPKVMVVLEHLNPRTWLVYVEVEHRASRTTACCAVFPPLRTHTSLPLLRLQVNLPLFFPFLLHLAPALTFAG